MKGKNFITNKNLNFKNLNFIIKKENVLYVKDTYKLKSGLEMAKLQFGKVKGIYKIPQPDIQSLIDNNSIRLSNQKFHVSQIVIHESRGRGVILGAEYDSIIAKCWIYRVQFDNDPSTKYKVPEGKLSSANQNQ